MDEMEQPSTQWNADQRTPSLSTLDRGLDVLESILAHAPEAGLASTALDTGLPKPTVHRILAQLVRRGYVVPVRPGTYGPGPQAFAAATVAGSASDFSSTALRHLEQLRTATPETIHVAVRVGHRAVYLSKLEAQRPYKMASAIGTSLNLHSTAIGKAILAYAPDSENVVATLALQSKTPRTITTRDALRRELEWVRNHGYALDNEENEEGVRCVAAAVFDASGAPVGGISVSAPTFNFPQSVITALLPSLLSTAKQISAAVGAFPGTLQAERAGR